MHKYTFTHNEVIRIAKEAFRTKKYNKRIKVTYTVELPDGTKKKKVWEADQHALIQRIIAIAEEYQSQNIKQTLRGYYYDLVSEQLIPNALEIYKRIGKLVNDLRYTGHIDWDAMEDRGRAQDMHAEWDNVSDLLDSAIYAYRLRRWEGQEYYIELFTEKDTMYPRLQPITDKYHIRLCINKGYSSSSVYYELSKRVIEKLEEGKNVIIFYVGDHDPSGLDMIRDLTERLTEFLEMGDEYYDAEFKVIPVALTKEQIKKYKLPPNPAKLSDSRAQKYIEEHGKISWEVDALKPQIMRQIVESEIVKHIDMDKYNTVIEKEKQQKKKLEEFGNKLSNNKGDAKS